MVVVGIVVYVFGVLLMVYVGMLLGFMFLVGGLIGLGLLGMLFGVVYGVIS